MITDAMLREAAAEAERFMLAHLPEIQEPHVFSKRFERKMQKLLARAKHPIRYQVVRYVAAVLLAIIMLFGTVLAVSPEVRATVFGWVRSTFYEYFQYESENTPNSTREEYKLAIAPDGYNLLNEIERANGKMYLYVDDSGYILQFAYEYGGNRSNVFVATEKFEQYSSNIHGLHADVYIATEDDETSVIVWEDVDSDLLFYIFAKVDKDKLISMAETVQKIEK